MVVISLFLSEELNLILSSLMALFMYLKVGMPMKVTLAFYCLINIDSLYG